MFELAKEEVLRRKGYSLLGPFTFFTVLLNWKVLLYIFSSIDVESKIQKISALNEQFVFKILAALVLTSVTVILIPILKVKYDKWILEREYQVKNRLAELNRKLSANEFLARNSLSVIHNSQRFFDSNVTHFQDKIKILNDLLLEKPHRTDAKFINNLFQSAIKEIESVMKTTIEVGEACNVIDVGIKATERLRK